MKRTRLQYLLMALAVFGHSEIAIGSDAGFQSPFSLGVTARSIGFGGAMTSLAADASSIYYNPGSLSHLEYQEFSFLHTVLFAGSLYDGASWVYPVSADQGIGIGFIRLGTGDIVRYEDFNDMDEFDYSSTQISFAYGRKLYSVLSAGATLKIVRQALDRFSDYGVGADFGISARLSDHFSFGVIARNFSGAKAKLQQTSEEIPTSFAAGLSMSRLMLSSTIEAALTADMEKGESRDILVRGGSEVLFYNTYALRGGYDGQNLVFGAGYNRGALSLDYAFTLIDLIGDSHHFSLSFRIGPSLTEKMRQQELDRLDQSSATDRLRRFEQNRQKADTFFAQFELDSALIYYQRALAFNETDQNIIGTIAAIENARAVQQQQEQNLRETEAEMRQSIRNYYDQANQLYGRRFYRPSLDLLSLIFDIQPDNSQALELKRVIEVSISYEIAANLNLADSTARLGLASEAIDAYNHVLDLDPINARALEGKKRTLSGLDLVKQLNAAIDLFNRQQFPEAAKRLTAILEANPNEKLAQEYLSRIQTSETHSTTFEDLQNDRTYWPIYLEGLRHMRNKKYEQAIAAWKRVLEAYPNNPNTLDNIEQAALRLQSEQGGQ
ncbi:MAG: PorV/PorQ family protein [candidate division Zixibacteria bacterium]|nr:PorV/PorQ family protein [candidate division Zixibacteria bacterium]